MLYAKGCKGFLVRVWENWGKIRYANEKICKVVKNPSFSTYLPSHYERKYREMVQIL